MKSISLICVLVLSVSTLFAEDLAGDKDENSGPLVLSAPCDYVVGDVNASENYNGLDINWGVNFFKGLAAPMCSPDCPSCETWFYCGDVNGSCTYNGLDINWGVNYFKGGPGPMFCPDCPSYR